MAASCSSVAGPRAAPAWLSDAAVLGSATASPGQSFARQYRLCTAAGFDKVFREGRRSADRLFTVLYCPNQLSHPRIGFALSRRRIRGAVPRNRVRRIVREHFRLARSQLAPADIVLLARDGTGAATAAEIRASIDRHWARIGLSPAAEATSGNSQ